MPASLLRRARTHRELLLVAALQIVLLWPALRTGYLFDDEVNSSFPGDTERLGTTYLAHSWDIASGWITGQGRFFPVSFFQGYAQFYLPGGVVAYKALLLVLVVLSTACLVALLRRLGVATAGPRPATVRFAGGGVHRIVRAAATPAPVALRVRVPARGASVVRVTTDGRRVKAPGDPRSLYVRLTTPRLTTR